MGRWLGLCFLLLSQIAFAQAATSGCPHDEQEIRAVLRDLAAARAQGGKALARYHNEHYADDAVISGDEGKRYTKSEYLAAMQKQDASNDTTSGGEPDEVFVQFAGDVAILSYVEKMKNVDLPTGAKYQGTFRESRVFGCDNGKWKIVFRSEIQRPNVTRVPVEAEHAKFDYVGHYRMVQGGKMLGEVTVTRDGNKLLEAWGKEPAEEILPGGHDTFFVRNDNTVEQFVRDEKNRVVGIHYIFWDDHLEAQRVEDNAPTAAPK